MKKIKLTQGKFAIVDDFAFPLLNQFIWHVDVDNKAKTTVWDRKKQKPVNVYMHRWLKMALKDDVVMHLNKNGLDNRMENLYIASSDDSRRLRQQKRRKAKKTSSKYKGVSFRKNRGVYQAYINKNGIRINLGHFKSEEEAGLAYNKKAKELFGDFARLNKLGQ